MKAPRTKLLEEENEDFESQCLGYKKKAGILECN